MPVPTDLFTTMEPQNPSHDVFELHKIRRTPDLEVLNFAGPVVVPCFYLSYYYIRTKRLVDDDNKRNWAMSRRSNEKKPREPLLKVDKKQWRRMR